MIPLLLASTLLAESQPSRQAPPERSAAAEIWGSPAQPKSAPERGSRRYPYASVQAGIGFPGNLNGTIDTGNPGGQFPTTLNLNDGFSGEVALGYKINDFRTDLSVGYGNFAVGSQTLNGAPISTANGSVNLWSVMLNGYYDVPLRSSSGELSRWSPYIGGGIGYANIGIPAYSNECCDAGNAGAFAYQAKVGLSYRASERGFAFLEGGYLGLNGFQVDPVDYDGIGLWRVSLGWRQGFGGAATSAKAVSTEPAPLPEAGPQAEPLPAAAPAPFPAPAPQPIRGLW